MKAIVRNVLLTCLISTFALFGALGRKHTPKQLAAMTKTQQAAIAAEGKKRNIHLPGCGLRRMDALFLALLSA